MNTMQLHCFLAVAETLNFARAAEQLNVTQPAVTQQIQSLEEELNTKLFKRTTRTVELTSSGKLFINDAKGILGISERAKRRFEEQAKQENQYFSIGCHTHAELYLLSNVLRKMKTIHPNFHPLFQVLPFQHLYKFLEDESLDVIISFDEGNKKKIHGIYKELFKVPIKAVCAADHRLANKHVLCRDDLRREILIINDPSKCPDSIAEIQSGMIESRPVSGLLFCEYADAAVVMAKAGYGIAIQPDLFATHDPDLSYIPLEGVSSVSYGVYYKQLKGKTILKDFVQIALSEFYKIMNAQNR